MTNKYNLIERTYNFSKSVVLVCKRFEYNLQNKIISDQLIRCSLSVSLNYSEADNAESPKDFKHKIGICRKESAEASLILRLVTDINLENHELKLLQQEAKELNLIFNKIYQTLRKKVSY